MFPAGNIVADRPDRPRDGMFPAGNMRLARTKDRVA
jgi:hypothetical protein